MYKISFNEYHTAGQYLLLFDSLMKRQGLNKDKFLASIGISPTSYRRAKVSEQKIGFKIVKTLAEYFGFKSVNSDEINQAEDFLNKVFCDVYFKRYDTLENFHKKINELLVKKDLLYPIYLLFKLFMNINEVGQREVIIDKNMNLYIEVKKYKDFFVKGLDEIFDAIIIFFSKIIPKEIYNKDYETGLVYFSLASQYNLKGEIYTSLFFADKAKAMLINENNYVKLVYLNLLYMLNYNLLDMYEKAYELADNQIHALEALGRTGFEYRTTIQHLVLSSLGLEKYKQIIVLLENKKTYQITDFLCLLISYYMTNKQEYEKLYKSLDDKIKEENCIDQLDEFLCKKTKTCLQKLQMEGLKTIIVKILEKNVLSD